MRSWKTEAVIALNPGKKDGKGFLDEPQRLGIKAALERVRSYIRVSIPARDQWRILQLLDAVQEHLARHQFDLEAVQRDLQNTKSTTRRQLHMKPAMLGQLLACFEGLEQEIVDFINVALKGTK